MNKPNYDLKITIQGGIGAGKTFAQQKIATFLTAYGYSVDVSDLGTPLGIKIAPPKTVQPNGRRVLIDTSIKTIRQ